MAATETLSRRMRDLVIDSPALDRYAMVRLLLPRRFQAEPGRRWPVLWLLHGCCDTYDSWTRSTDVEELAALDEALVVMPEAGQVGFYSDWRERSRSGLSRWETFHLTELRQLLERDWRAGDRRVVAGLSMGGLGAMTYAARHPGMFGAAAFYSGLLHTRYQGDPIPGPKLIQDLLGDFGENPGALWGDPRRQGELWAEHNPYDLASRLHGVRLFISFGNGRPGPLDPPTVSGEARPDRAKPLPAEPRVRRAAAPTRHPCPVQQLRPGHPRLALLAAGAAPVPAPAAPYPPRDAGVTLSPRPPDPSVSRTKLMRQFSVGATAVAAAGGYATLYRLGQTWGATNQERRKALVGDDLLPNARAWTTHAITIEAPAPEVWPWLAQMGWGRAGWYTYRWVDRLLFPANGPSADQILPEHQRLQEGDRVPDGPPEVDCWFSVERREPSRLLVLRSTRHLPASWRQRGLAMEWIWSWHLHEPTSGQTRVVQRNRMRLDPWWFERAFLATIVPADFVMARSHLRGLRDRVEGAASSAVRNRRISQTAGL